MNKLLITIVLIFSVTSVYSMTVKEWQNSEDSSLIPYVDTMLGIAYAFEPPSGYDVEKYLLATVRPFIGFGCRPFIFLKLKNSPAVSALKGLGFGVHTKIFSTGIHMYFSHIVMKPFFLAFTLGWDWYGNTIPGASFGTRF